MLVLAGCGTATPPPAVSPGPSYTPNPTGESDPDRVRSADYSILFLGNSHTAMHDLPDLVCRMIRFRFPDKTTYSHYLPVTYLADVAHNQPYQNEVETRSWKYLVLQAQKISMSGKYEYSRTEGIEFAKRGKARGGQVVFYPEWGLQGVAGDGPRQEKVYQEMAAASGAQVAPVGRAWDRALERRPELKLYQIDGNHQSEVGAFLTACVLAGQITGQSPSELAKFPDEYVSEADRRFLAGVAAEVLIRTSEKK